MVVHNRCAKFCGYKVETIGFTEPTKWYNKCPSTERFKSGHGLRMILKSHLNNFFQPKE